MSPGGAEPWRALYPFTSRFIEIDGHRLHYVDEGPRDAPVCLCLHGNPTWSFYWRSMILAFRDRYRMIALDHLGCGLSDKPQDWPYRLDGHIRNVQAFADALDLRGITLAVHDWGGAIGSGFAVRAPERVSRLVITNTAAFPSPTIPLRIAVCRIPGFGALAVRGLNGFARAATIMATERGLPAEVQAGLLAPYDSWANRIATLRFVEDIPMAAGHPSWQTLVDVGNGLASLADRPVFIAWGEKDWCFTPAYREEWERRFPHAQVLRVADAGHYLLEDAAPEVLAWLAERL